MNADMIIERNILHCVVRVDQSISEALKRLDYTHQGFVICVNEAGVLEGVFTDGDVRRWLMHQQTADLSQPVTILLNPKCVVAYDTEDADIIHRRFSDQIKFIPLLDSRHRLIGVIRQRSLMEGFSLAGRIIDDHNPVFTIAEIGLNHNGSPEMARRLILAAKEAGADCAKFQMRNLSKLYRNPPGTPMSAEDLGAQYTLNLLHKFELNPDDMRRLFDFTHAQGLIPLCTPWEEDSLAILEQYGMEGYKVASADLTNHPFLEALSHTHKPLLLSTGMSSENEIKSSIEVLRRCGAPYGLLHCNATYPAPFKDINLAYIPRLKSIGGCPVGYSGHERGIHIPIAAVAQGVRIVEKHITLDRGQEGSDHKASLLPDEFKRMVQGIRQVEEALGSCQPRVPSQGELMNRSNLAKSLVAACPLKEGDRITESAVLVRSPGRGLQPNRKKELLGRRVNRDMQPGDFFFESDVDEPPPAPRLYRFSRPWGITVRWHDFQTMQKLSKPDFLEFHLSFKDMEEDYIRFFDAPLDMDFKVHSPDTFNGDHLLDLANPDPEHRERSICELQKVVEITRKLKPFFTKATKPAIIASLGGFSTDGFLSDEEVNERYALLEQSLKAIDDEGVEILAQTLPPFPWYFGGQMYLNLFVKPMDTIAFCQKTGRRLCLDISHSKLACNHYRLSFQNLVESVAPYTAHLHIADAKGTDGEGLQIGEGEIDFLALGKQLRVCCPQATFMPEIWQGHKNHGEGFWTALQSLEKYEL
jgi:sialic acid synthase SpsE/sugar phosphate isomerase/epimerase/CBS domain-containing protein